MTTRPPIVGAETWLPVMEKANHRCECKGACGQKHAKTEGRCDMSNHRVGHPPLIAAPADLSRATWPGAAMKAQPLIAWCRSCYGRALDAAKKAAAAEPVPMDALFDMDPVPTARRRAQPDTGRA